MFSELQFAVLDEVEARLSSVEGYEGICLDSLSDDEAIAHTGFENTVQMLVEDTVYADSLALPEINNESTLLT